MRHSIVFRMEDLNGKVVEYKPSLLNNPDPEVKRGLKAIVLKSHGLKYVRFMELYHDELEKQGLMITPVEEEDDGKAGNSKG